MDTWKFYLVLDDAELTETDCDALHEAGCDDGVVVSRDGVTYIAFDRQAKSFEAAVNSATIEVLNAGYPILRAEVDDSDAPKGSRHVVYDVESLLQEEGLRDYFGHFVALSGCYHQIDCFGNPTGHAGAFHYSGFVLELGGDWYWVTAGHVFDNEEPGEEGLEIRRERGEIEIDRIVLNDLFCRGEEGWSPIPFTYWNYESIKCYDKQMGLDFAAVKLTSHYRQLLEANGIVPFSEANWQHGDLSRFEHFFLIGLPAELEDTQVQSEHAGYHVRTKPTPAAVYITRVEDVPTESAKPIARFVGRVKPEAGSIKGMSGGPILGVRRDDPTHYLIALQSSRPKRKSSRLTFGCPISVLIESLLENEAKSAGTAAPTELPT